MFGKLQIYRFRCLFETDGIVFDELPGNLFRSVLGKQLREMGSGAFASCFEPSSDHAAPPYWLTPPMRTVYSAGEAVLMEVTLTEAVVQWWPDIVLALQKAGAFGIGRRRHRLRLTQVWSLGPDGSEVAWIDGRFVGGARPVSARRLLDESSAEPANALLVRMATPLWLKRNNRNIDGVPELALLLRALFQRLWHLTGESIDDAVAEPLLQYALRAYAEIAQDGVMVVGNAHYSARQQRLMPQFGLMGEMLYHGPNLHAIAPWMRLGEWLHLGKKTTHGFGVVRVNQI